MFMRLVLVLLSGFAFSVAGCGSDSDGGDDENTAGGGGNAATGLTCKYSNCPKEVVLYERQEECDALMATPCYPKHKVWIDCKLSNEQCNAEGKTEASSVASCKSLLEELNQCIADSPM
jgi:hypothetical protein